MPLAKRLPSSSSSGDDGNDEEILNALMDKYGALASQVRIGVGNGSGGNVQIRTIPTMMALPSPPNLPTPQVSYGSVLGYGAGYASKQIGKRIAALIGTGYIALQAMAYSGYIDVKWGKVRKTCGRHQCCLPGGGV